VFAKETFHQMNAGNYVAKLLNTVETLPFKPGMVTHVNVCMTAGAGYSAAGRATATQTSKSIGQQIGCLDCYRSAVWFYFPTLILMARLHLSLVRTSVRGARALGLCWKEQVENPIFH
jgi:hypothetical protein